MYSIDVYKKIDTSMHPELDHAKLKEFQSKEESQQESWWKSWKSFKGAVTKLVNRISSSDRSESKRLPIVKTYLAEYDKFITGKIKLNLNPVEVVDKIIYIVISLLNNSFHINGTSLCSLYSDIKLVSKLQLMFPY